MPLCYEIFPGTRLDVCGQEGTPAGRSRTIYRSSSLHAHQMDVKREPTRIEKAESVSIWNRFESSAYALFENKVNLDRELNLKIASCWGLLGEVTQQAGVSLNPYRRKVYLFSFHSHHPRISSSSGTGPIIAIARRERSRQVSATARTSSGVTASKRRSASSGASTSP